MELETQINKLSPSIIRLFIIIGSALLFIPFLGLIPLFDWDENNFAEIAREMIVSGNYLQVQINFEPFYEKPPLFFWLQALSMKVFGVNEFAARLPNAIAGIATLKILFSIGRKLYNNFFGVLWALAYIGAFLPHFYFKSGIIDPVFNLFIFLGVWFFLKNTLEKNILDSENGKRAIRIGNFVLSGSFLGLAVLTKGPVGFLIAFLAVAVYMIVFRTEKVLRWHEFFIWCGAALVVSLTWFGVEWAVNGFDFIREFFIRQVELFSTPDAGHGQPFFYHFIVVFFGCFPVSIFLLKGWLYRHQDSFDQDQVRKWMAVLFWVVIILFSLVTTKIIHYSSMTYLPLSFLAAHFLYGIKQKWFLWGRWQTILLTVVGFIFGIVFTVLPFLAKEKEWLQSIIEDPFARANLEANVQWSGWEALIGAGYLLIMMAAMVFIFRKQYFKGAVTSLAATVFAVQLLLPIIMPKVERYTQGAAIDFYEKAGEEEKPIQVLNFKSYGYLFYSRPQTHIDKGKMLDGKVPGYFVTKNMHADFFVERYEMKVLEERNGYVLLEKK